MLVDHQRMPLDQLWPRLRAELSKCIRGHDSTAVLHRRHRPENQLAHASRLANAVSGSDSLLDDLPCVLRSISVGHQALANPLTELKEPLSRLLVRKRRSLFTPRESVLDESGWIVLKAGDIGCLLGASGCGKTTLLRAIAGFEPVSAGEIFIAGECISHSGWQLPVEKRQVGMVFQDYALFPHMNVRDNIAFGLRALASTARRQRVDELAAMLRITELLEAWPHRLSGGQQQRVALARAQTADSIVG
jgi:ABC-type glutathione transport system ATPase component